MQVNENETSSMGERMANVAVVPSKIECKSVPRIRDADKWTVMAMKGEISWEEADRRGAEELAEELGLSPEEI